MACDLCVFINPIPGCLGEDVTEFLLTGITFTDNTSEDLIAKVTNLATGRKIYLEFDTNGSGVPTLDIFDLFPLPNHPYRIDFTTTSGAPVTVTVDDTEDTGCCLEFTVDTRTTEEETFELTAVGCTQE